MQTDYERLIKEGYTEEEIKVEEEKLKNISKMNINDKQMIKTSAKEAHLTDSHGYQHRNRILIGKKIQLENGSYFNEEELKEALKKSINESSENKTVIFKKTGKTISVDEIVENVIENLHEKDIFKLGDGSEKIRNQMTSRVFVKSKEMEEFITKGILMLGNKGIKMPNGEYLNSNELETALKEYIMMEKPNLTIEQQDHLRKLQEQQQLEKQMSQTINIDISTETIKPTNEQQNDHQPQEIKQQNEKKKVIKRQTTKWNLTPIIAAGMVIATMGFGVKMPYAEAEVINKTISIIETNFQSYTEQDIYESFYDTIERVAPIETGDKIMMKEGINYYASSDKKAPGKGTFGTGLREAGEYTVDYISILSGDKIIKKEFQLGKNLSEVVRKTAIENNLDSQNLKIMLHVGGPVSGWVDFNEIYNQNELTPQSIGTKIIVDQEYKVTSNDNKTVTINTEHGPVTLNVRDDYGNYIEEGSIVKGSDGQNYRLSNISQVNQQIIERIEVKEELKFNYSIHNIADEIALLTAAAGLLATLATKEEKTEKITKEEAEKILNEAKEKYEKNSNFSNFLKKINSKRPKKEIIDMVIKKRNFIIDELEYQNSEGRTR